MRGERRRSREARANITAPSAAADPLKRGDHADVLAALEQMGREEMAKRMKRKRLAQPGGLHSVFEQPAELASGQRLMIVAAGKQLTLFRCKAGVILGRSRLSTTAATGAGPWAAASHVGPCGPSTARRGCSSAYCRCRTPAIAPPRRPAAIGDARHHARLQACHHGENALDLIGAQHRRQLLRLLEVPHLGRQIVAQRDAEQVHDRSNANFDCEQDFDQRHDPDSVLFQ
jgi:hypothetical protein